MRGRRAREHAQRPAPELGGRRGCRGRGGAGTRRARGRACARGARSRSRRASRDSPPRAYSSSVCAISCCEEQRRGVEAVARRAQPRHERAEIVAARPGSAARPRARPRRARCPRDRRSGCSRGRSGCANRAGDRRSPFSSSRLAWRTCSSLVGEPERGEAVRMVDPRVEPGHEVDQRRDRLAALGAGAARRPRAGAPGSSSSRRSRARSRARAARARSGLGTRSRPLAAAEGVCMPACTSAVAHATSAHESHRAAPLRGDDNHRLAPPAS